MLQFLRLFLFFIVWGFMLPFLLLVSMSFVIAGHFLPENIHAVHQELCEYL